MRAVLWIFLIIIVLFFVGNSIYLKLINGITPWLGFMDPTQGGKVDPDIIRLVKVDRTMTPQEVLDATGRKRGDQWVGLGLDSAPHGEGETVEVVFFQVGRRITEDELQKEYELRGLIPADFYSLAAANGADLVFADTHRNVTHWKDASGKWCYEIFGRWDSMPGYDDFVRAVIVGCRGDYWVNHNDNYDWFGNDWFAGIRKVGT
jgi:hypothetical protein